MRRVPWILGLCPLLWVSPSLAQDPFWQPDSGVSVCATTCSGDFPRVVQAGNGGAYVAWETGTSDDILMQRITPEGFIASGWPPAGLPIAVYPNAQRIWDISGDGSGGVLIIWEDQRDPARGTDIFAQRVRPDGTLAPGWPEGGALIADHLASQFFPVMAQDQDNGGLYAAWIDDRDLSSSGKYRVLCTRMTPMGETAPGWPADGRVVSAHNAFDPEIVANPAGGFVVVWVTGDEALGGPAPEVFAQHFLPDGSRAPGWPEEGLLLAVDRNHLGKLVPDAAGGFFVGTRERDEYLSDKVYRLHRLRFDGTVAPGWPADGIVICDAPETRAGLTLASDGDGGVLVAWYDYRDPTFGSDIYALRVLPDGSVAPGWTVNGTRVGDRTGSEFTVHIVQDGVGGAYVVWERESLLPRSCRIQHLTATGQVAEGWPEGGDLPVSTSFSQFCPSIAADGMGGVLVAWDERSPPRSGAYAQRFAADGIVQTRPSLVSAETDADAIRLRWHALDARLLEAAVYRRTEVEPWQHLGVPEATVPDELYYEDRAVTAGVRYAYRLGYMEGGAESFTEETWVEAAAPLALALHGFQPNPALAGQATVRFTLATAAPASLAIYDVRGRRVYEQDVGALGPGHHAVSVDGDRLTPGIYVIRLRQETETLHARGAVVR